MEHRSGPVRVNPRFVGSAVGFGGRSGWSAGGLVVTAGVEHEFAQEFAGGGVDDGDLQVLDEEEDVGSGVGSADADVVEPGVDPEDDGAAVVDLVGADPVVDLAGPVGVGGDWFLVQ
jgi:hypothetical protein